MPLTPDPLEDYQFRLLRIRSGTYKQLQLDSRGFFWHPLAGLYARRLQRTGAYLFRPVCPIYGRRFQLKRPPEKANPDGYHRKTARAAIRTCDRIKKLPVTYNPHISLPVIVVQVDDCLQFGLLGVAESSDGNNCS